MFHVAAVAAQSGDVKATPYEFMSAWIALKNSQDVEPYLDIVKQVKPHDLPKGSSSLRVCSPRSSLSLFIAHPAVCHLPV